MAGTYATGAVAGDPGKVYNVPVSVPVNFVADAADGSVPTAVVDNVAGFLVDVRVIFGGTPPNSVSVVVNDVDGVDLLDGEGAAIIATGKVSLAVPVVFVGGLSVVVTGNTTTSADFKVVLYVI